MYTMKTKQNRPTKQPNKLIMGKTKKIIQERQPYFIVTSENDVVIEIDQNGQQIFKFDPNDCVDYTINSEPKSLPINNWYKLSINK